MPVVPFQGFKPRIHSTAFVAQNATIIGKTKLGKLTNVWFSCVLRGDGPGIAVGSETNVQDLTMIHTTSPDRPTVIGSRVTIGHSCLLHACRIDDDAFVGMGSLLLDNVHVAPFSMVAAGSLVTPNTQIPSYELWGGRPARKMRALKDSDLEMFGFTWKHYVDLGQAYMNKPAFVLGTKNAPDGLPTAREYLATQQELDDWNLDTTQD